MATELTPTDAQLLSLAKRNQITTMIEEAEHHEISQFDCALSPTFFQLLCMGHLIEGDLVNARQVLKRCGSVAMQDPLTIRLHNLVVALWNRDYKAAIQGCLALQFPPLDTMLRASLINKVAVTQLKAYDSCTLADVVTATGVASEADAKEALVAGNSVKIQTDGSLRLVVTKEVKGWGDSTLENVTESSMILRKPLQ